MDNTLEHEKKIVENGDPINDLFFDPNPSEKIIETPSGTHFQFTIKGLSAFEVEEISGKISKEVEVDPLTKKPIVKLDPGQYNYQIVLKGVSRAACNGNPIPWDEETVQRLKGWIRDELLEEIKQRSDGLSGFKKS